MAWLRMHTSPLMHNCDDDNFLGFSVPSTIPLSINFKSLFVPRRILITLLRLMFTFMCVVIPPHKLLDRLQCDGYSVDQCISIQPLGVNIIPHIWVAR